MAARYRAVLAACASMLALVATLGAQAPLRTLTIDAIYDPGYAGRLQRLPPDGHHVARRGALPRVTPNGRHLRVAQGGGQLRPLDAALRRRPHGSGARGAARRDARRSVRHRALGRSHAEPLAHRDALLARRRSLLLRLRLRARLPPDDGAWRRGRSDVQPGRPPRRVRPGEQSLRRRCGVGAASRR